MKSYKKVCSISGHKTVLVKERIWNPTRKSAVLVDTKLSQLKKGWFPTRKSSLILEAAVLVDTRLFQLKKGWNHTRVSPV